MSLRTLVLLGGVAALLGGCVVAPHPHAHRPHYDDNYYYSDDDYYDYHATPSYEGYFYVRVIFIGNVPWYVDDNRHLRPIPRHLHDHFRKSPYRKSDRHPPVFSRDHEVRDGYPMSRIVYLDNVPHYVEDGRVARPLPNHMHERFRASPFARDNGRPEDNRRNNERGDEAPAYGRERERHEPPAYGRERERNEPPAYGRERERNEPPAYGRERERNEPPAYGRERERNEPPAYGRERERNEPPAYGRERERNEPPFDPERDRDRARSSPQDDSRPTPPPRERVDPRNEARGRETILERERVRENARKQPKSGDKEQRADTKKRKDDDEESDAKQERARPFR